MRDEGPEHYRRLDPEPIDVIRAWDLPFTIGNVVKYVARYRFKDGVEDLKKARHYLDLEIEAMESAESAASEQFVTTTPLENGMVRVDVWERPRPRAQNKQGAQ